MHRLAQLGVQLVYSPKGGFMIQHSSMSSLVVDMKSKKHLVLVLMELRDSVPGKSIEDFSQGGEGVLGYQDRL